VLITPFKLARVSAAIASGGVMPQGRWLPEQTNMRNDPPRRVLNEADARFLADAMRAVVTSGTGRAAMAGLDVQVAGKTGTAQTNGEAHSWFTGFAPYDAPPSDRIAFAIVVEHGGYGARAAAPIAREIIAAARDLGIIAKR
jgi:peptidoglycan glycosyltransferase